MKRRNPPPKKKSETLDVNEQQLDDLLDRAESTMNDEDFELTCAVFESYVYVADLVGQKNMTIKRLQKILFGSKSEKAKDILADVPAESSHPSTPADLEAATTDAESTDDTADNPKSPPKGHGRNGADAYPGAERIEFPLEGLEPGCPCPDCRRGTLYDYTPGVIVRVHGQAPLQAKVYELQKLRCHTCGRIFTASPPDDIGEEKYDATAASMIGLLKYGSGLPFNRLERLQSSLEIPLPASTQWDIVNESASNSLSFAYQELIRQAAQGDVLYNDDTTVKILELMRLTKQKKEQNQDEPGNERTGMFTSGVISTGQGNRIALFFSGRQHAGENLEDVLQHRADQLETPIQMCDGLSRNLPKQLKTIVSNCLVHARRNFVEIHDNFPDECGYVIKALKIIYKNDRDTRKKKLSRADRLRFHQKYSQPVMDDLLQWLNCQLDEKLVEPNSALGSAINYMLSRWDRLTLFLRREGAPLDNNITERALKKAILHRKNSLFFKTTNGAIVSDIHMSLIYTCELSSVNAFDYLTELQRNTDEVVEHPELWMPWNYRQTLESKSKAA